MPPAARDVDAAQFRQLCGHFATGVVIITAMAKPGEPAGMTANSFASVSLSPPLISINVDHAAEMHGVLLDAQEFALNVVESAQEALSRRFAGKEMGRFDGVGYRVDDRGFVLLDGALATLACVPHARFDAGDHTIFVGRVTGGSVAPGRPLLYYRGGYMTGGPA
ncbi:MAG TPA: flavin reductase family protein [Gemmatimonadales bacterium]|jgi:flavin reductase (DIM6/NTAB) family NADH-FMN oxidoreductase RutF|nr:flavin reductase family protein [Gemmatimonadales bacterium]